VQINYQAVVGWQYKKVLLQLQESTTDVLLTLKKTPYRWDSLPSPRVEFFNIPDLLMPMSKAITKEMISDIEDSSGNESDVS
jgi:hypothetical protein